MKPLLYKERWFEMRKMVFVISMVMASLMAMALKKDPDYLDARRNGADAQLNICVVDNDGAVVSNASIKVFMGMNFRPKGYWIDGNTSENGIFLAQGKTCGDEIEIFASKKGFYSSRLKLSFAKMGAEREVKGGKWLPYGATGMKTSASTKSRTYTRSTPERGPCFQSPKGTYWSPTRPSRPRRYAWCKRGLTYTPTN